MKSLIKILLELIGQPKEKEQSDPHLFKIEVVKNFKTRNIQEYKDERKAECPYCLKPLPKIPGANRKCPYCGNYMYVRTRIDNVRVVVTEEEMKKIEEARRIENGTQEEFLLKQKKFSDKKKLLRNKYGFEPKDNDIKWALLNEDLLEYSKKRQWGFYRMTRMKMAQILENENKLKGALMTYLGICYLDLNGPTNMPLDENGNVVDMDEEIFMPFDPECKFTPLTLKDTILEIIETLKLEKQEVKDIYLNFANKLHKSTRAPIAPIDTWEEMENELW